MDPVALPLLACPCCAGPLTDGAQRLICPTCARPFDVTDGIANLRLAPEPGAEEPADDRRTEVVRHFYTAAPFPNYRDGDTLLALRQRAARSAFARQLDRAIAPDARVLDLGCGTGQMTLYLATGQRTVIGADLTRASLALGAAAARRFGVAGAQFVETDLRRPGLAPGAFDVVFCSGALHHVPSPGVAFASLVHLVRPGGILLLGLYNAYARFPHRLRRLLARLSGFRLFVADPVMRDRRCEPARRQAWLRDQYQHPEEHRHTLGEVQRWFRRSGVDYLRTYPATVWGDDDVSRADTSLFTPAADNFWPETVMCQLSWMKTLAHEGGLFVAVGRRL